MNPDLSVTFVRQFPREDVLQYVRRLAGAVVEGPSPISVVVAFEGERHQVTVRLGAASSHVVHARADSAMVAVRAAFFALRSSDSARAVEQVGGAQRPSRAFALRRSGIF